MPIGRRAALALLVVFASPLVADESAPLVINPDLVRWQGDIPEGWTSTVGAVRDPDGPTAVVEPLDGGGFALEGDEATRRWPLLAQRVAAAPGAYLEASFDVRLAFVRDGREDFSSRYVALVACAANGRVLAMSLADVHTDRLETRRLVIACPPATTHVELRVFLSTVGRLEVRRVGLRRLVPSDSLDVLARTVARVHPDVARPEVRWDARVALAQLAPERIADPAAFVDVAVPLLAALEDEHVVLVRPDGTRVPTWTSPIDVGFSLPALRAALDTIDIEPRVLIDGRTPDGLAVILVDSLPADERLAARLEDAARRAVDAPGLLVDLRTCSGGDERVAARMARWWADAERVYARTEVRRGDVPTEFVEVEPRRIGPPAEHRYDKPIVVLLGPGCVSSGEGLAMMLRTLPHARLFGRNTRGSSGNPQPTPLPNGVTLLCSSWRTRLPAGSPIERVGVPPDVRIDRRPTADGKDPLLDAALAALRDAVRRGGHGPR